MPFDKQAYWENKGKKQPRTFDNYLVCGPCMDAAKKIKIQPDRQMAFKVAFKGPFIKVPDGYYHKGCPNSSSERAGLELP